MKYFFISVLIHLSLFLYTSLLWKEKVVATRPNVNSNIIHISLKLQEKEVKELERKITKVKKSTRKKVQSKVSQNTKSVVAREKKSKVKGKELLQEYIAEIRSFIERQKYYPKKALRMRQSGSVEICLDIDHEGHFHDIHIKKASRYSTLNNAALELIKKISKFRPLPKELGSKTTLNIPLKYALTD